MNHKNKEVTILTVDDEKVVSARIYNYLREQDYNVIEAKDGYGDLEKLFEKKHPDVVLVNLNLTEPYKIKLIKNITHVFKGTPVLVLSNQDNAVNFTEINNLSVTHIPDKETETLDLLNMTIQKTIEDARQSNKNENIGRNKKKFHGKEYLLDELNIEIEKRKQIESDLRLEKEKSENEMKIKDKFVSLVAHDLRSPAISIEGLLKILLFEESKGLNEEQLNILNEVMISVKKMKLFINDILNISRFKTGRLKPSHMFINANELSARAIDGFNFLAKKKGINLINSVPVDKYIYADETLFFQVIENLLSNAIKFSKNGDNVNIFVPREEKSTIAVSDTGIGINKQRKEKLFDYTEKTSTEGTMGEVGTGLGLPLCQDIMLAHDGELYVESEEEKGSTFYARLPFVNPRILIVDDEPGFRLQQRLYLAPIGAEIIEAGNGEEALSLIAANRPHLVMTDIRMPVMDGFELLKNIKSNPETKSIPVIVMTGYQEIEYKDTVFRYRAEDFVTKPLEPDELIPRVKRFVGVGTNK